MGVFVRVWLVVFLWCGFCRCGVFFVVLLRGCCLGGGFFFFVGALALGGWFFFLGWEVTFLGVCVCSWLGRVCVWGVCV